MNWIWFIVGMVFGGCIATVLMCCLSIRRINQYEAEIKRLRSLIER